MKPYLVALLILVLLVPSLPSVSGAVTSVEVTPENPVQGDVVEIAITASPGEAVSVRLSFTTEIEVVDGEYELLLDGVDVPQTPTSISAKATGVENLKVAVKMGVWFTKSVDAVDGVATVSQGGIPEGQYEAKIYGDAEAGESKVTLAVTATTTITMDDDGTYNLEYDTSAIPPGDFTAKIGGITKELTLDSSGGGGGGGSGGEPMAVATFPDEVYVGEVVKFDGSGSYSDEAEIVDWEWDFGDDSSDSGSVVEHAYDKVGKYTVTLTVTDEFDLSASDSWDITVLLPPNEPPVSEPGSDRVIFLGGAADFDGGASYDPDGEIVSYVWSFGDGSDAEGVRASRYYSATGIYRVSLTVRDDDGAEESSGLIVTVVDPPVEPDGNYTVRLSEGLGQVIRYGNSSLPLTVTLNVTSPVAVTILTYPENPYPDVPLPLNSIPLFYDLSLSNPDAIDWPILVEVDCSNLTDTELGRLGLFYCNGEDWILCQQTGVRSDGVVWALLSRSEASGSPLIVGEKTTGASFKVSGFTVEPLNAYTGAEITVSLTIVNVGAEEGDTTLSLLVNGQTEADVSVSLASGESRQVSLTFTRDVAGTYLVELGGFSAKVYFTSPPSPADIVLTGLEVSPQSVDVGGAVSVSAGFMNQGEVEGTRSVEVTVNGQTFASRVISLKRGESTVLRVSITLTNAGQQTISVDGVNQVVNVVGEESNSSEGWDPLLILGVVAILFVGAVLLYRRRSRRINSV